MAEASGFRWTTLRVAALYPLALIPILLRTIVFMSAAYAHPMRHRAPGGAALVGVLAAGACELVITRTLALEWSASTVALASYVAGGLSAAAVHGYIELVRSEFPPKRP